MKNIDDFIEVAVNTGDEYKVMIGNDLLNKTGEILSALGFKKIAIITDNKVWSIYKEELEKSLKCSNIHYEVLIFLHGENSKSVQNYLKGIDFLAENLSARMPPGIYKTILTTVYTVIRSPDCTLVIPILSNCAS